MKIGRELGQQTAYEKFEDKRIKNMEKRGDVQ